MHLPSTATLFTLSVLSLVRSAHILDLEHVYEQAVLSQQPERLWSGAAIGPVAEDTPERLDIVRIYLIETALLKNYLTSYPPQTHPTPPHIVPGTDPWNLSSFHDTTYHDTYHPLFEVNAYMEHLAALFPARISLLELGHSAQGREMFAMRITADGVSTGADADAQGGKKRQKGKMKEKKGFVITGAQHAREWVASAAAMYIAHSLASSPNSSSPSASSAGSLSHLLDDFDFHIIPVPNPDGYVFTWENDRLWYKNRMPVGPDEPCQGLDLNRNWGYQWSPSADYANLNRTESEFEETHSQPGPLPADPCSHWYPGHRPYEAPEVNNIANYVTRASDLEAFLDLRSYGQMISWPYSYACDSLPPDAENLYEAALGIAHAVKKKHGTVYTTGSLCSMLYPAPGNILDWMYGYADIKYSYAAHLRDTGTPDTVNGVKYDSITSVSHRTHKHVDPVSYSLQEPPPPLPPRGAPSETWTRFSDLDSDSDSDLEWMWIRPYGGLRPPEGLVPAPVPSMCWGLGAEPGGRALVFWRPSKAKDEKRRVYANKPDMSIPDEKRSEHRAIMNSDLLEPLELVMLLPVS
ncbi:hypothetical protein EW145_g5378 [Phellinidium pouzarii]|uniref:Inactive metallocarboxypeptidase ECM14 n=1 Tax=Phellinidium pouzarii TaxID=167371 RepID=A0A4S4L054_9AGAM|nr:hypothetical protein EW145_g5378 [Phellinidium pouzarii]